MFRHETLHIILDESEGLLSIYVVYLSQVYSMYLQTFKYLVLYLEIHILHFKIHLNYALLYTILYKIL